MITINVRTGAVLGLTPREGCVLPTAAALYRRLAITPWVSVSPDHSNPLFFNLLPFTAHAVRGISATSTKAADLTQAEVAARMGIKPSSLARIEGSLGNHKHSPSLETLRKYARACGKRLEIRLV